jgi:hypothetical protein
MPSTAGHVRESIGVVQAAPEAAVSRPSHEIAGDHDDLAPARGILLGAAIGAVALGMLAALSVWILG